MSAIPDKGTLFEFVALKQSENEKKFISINSMVYLRNNEQKKYIDIEIN